MSPNILVRLKYVPGIIENDAVPGPAAYQALAVAHQIRRRFGPAHCHIKRVEDDGDEAQASVADR
jgi:hypothetical protein